MKSSLILLAGVVLGTAVVLVYLNFACGITQNPVLSMVPGIDQIPCPRTTAPVPSVLPVVLPAAPPTPIPAPVVDLKKAKMVEKTVYAEMEYTVHTVGKWSAATVFDRSILEKEVVLITTGVCTAGIDYSASPAVIDRSGTQVVVRLRAPEIFSCGVNSATYFDGKGLIPAPTDLYNRMYSEADREIQNKARGSELLSRATDSARTQVELYLRRIGFERVTVEIPES